MEIEIAYPFENLTQDYAELRENLARNGSLRRKDFDNMMQGLLSSQDKKEKEVKALVNDYFKEQKQITQTLKEKLEEFKESLARGESQRVQEFQVFVKEILTGQEQRKEGTNRKLKEFQKEQEVMSGKLKELLAKGRDLRAKDFKIMLQELGIEREERLVRVREILASAQKYKRGGE